MILLYKKKYLVNVKEFESNQINLVNFRGGTFNSQECCPIFNSLLCPPSPPPTTSITADDFATFFTDKTKTISSQCSPPLTQDLQPTRSTAQTPIFSFCPLTEAEVSKVLFSSHPTTCSLDPIPSHLLQAISLKEHHLQLNLAKTELLVFPATPTLQHDFTIQLGSSTITPSASVRNLGVIFDGQLTFKEHIAKTAQSCRFALHNIRKIRPFLTEHAAQLLVQALVISRLDYCNALLAGLPSNTIKPLQMIQNAAARLVFNEPKRAHVTPLFVSLHWLPVAARIKFKTLMLAYRTTTGSAPTYFHSLLRIYIPSRSLRSASERRLVVPSQRGSKSLSRTFSFTVPGRWNDLPTPIRNAGSLLIFKQQLKTHLFRHYLTSS